MNKIKLLYDVVMAMKDKETFNGTFKAEGKKDQVKIFSFSNEFEKNKSTGEGKAKINMELDHEGKKIKHESTSEFNMPNCHEHMHHGFMKHMHFHHHHGHHNHDDIKCGGVKGKLTMLAFMLNVLNNMKVDEQEDKSVILSVNLSDIPDDLKQSIHEKMKHHHHMHEHHEHHGFVKELQAMENPNVEINIWISKNNEVEKVVATIDGKQNDETSGVHEMNVRAELSLAW